MNCKLNLECIRIKNCVLDELIIGVVIRKPDGTVYYVNDAFVNIWGISSVDEIEGANIHEVLEMPDRTMKSEAQLFQNGILKESFVATRKDGSTFDLLATSHLIKDERDNPLAVVGFFTDISFYKQSKDLANILKTAIEQTPAVFVLTDTNGAIQYVNPAFTSITGYSLEEVFGESHRNLQSGQFSDDVYNELWQTITAGDTWQGELLNKRKDNGFYSEEVLIAPIKNEWGEIIHFMILGIDITDKKNKETELRRLAKRNENLLIEINHRVKNNLANITALAHIELDNEKKSKQDAIEDIISRIDAIGVMHELLYTGESFEEVNIKDYITNFSEQIDAIYEGRGSITRFNYDIEPLRFSTKLTTTIGIILSEFLTNTYKYAISDGIIDINISLHKENERILFVYSDSGSDLSEDIKTIDDLSTGTGTMLIKELVASLEGTIELDTTNGMTYAIEFCEEKDRNQCNVT
jgi:PAS domain S-box-containing protein